MGKLKDILIDGHTALRTVQRDLPNVENLTVDELKYCVDDGSFYVLLGMLDEDELTAERYVISKEHEYGRSVELGASEYNLVMRAAVSMIELTEFVPEILATLAEEA